MRYSSLFALISGAAAQFRGFNYGNLDLDGTPRTLQDFEDQFNAARELPGTNGVFTSARLFTMIQAGTSGDLITAIQAAVNTDTSLLLGLWGSAGQANFDLELAALAFAIEEFGEELSSRVAGISVGSEDLYRNSPTGIANESGAGANPAELVSYIGQVRELIEGTVLADATIGHVDTWTAWVNGSNSAVVEAVDWLGTDAYPYFQGEEDNSVEAGEDLFFAAYDAVVGAAQGKPVWVTETGWPVAGPQLNQAETGPSQAQEYWRAVSCRLQASDVNLWWFTLDDDQATSDDVSFSLVNPDDLFGEPLFDLTCDADDDDSTTTSSVATTATGTTSATGVVFPTASVSVVSTVEADTSVTATIATETMVTATAASPDATETGAVDTPVAPSVSATTTEVVYDGSAVRSGSMGGFAAFAFGLAAWAL